MALPLQQSGGSGGSSITDISNGASGAGYFIGGVNGFQLIAAGGAETVSASANKVSGIMFVLPAPITIRKVTIVVTADAANSKAGFGIYSENGSTLLLDAEFSTAATGTLTTTLGSPVTLPAGVYLFAFGCSSASVQCDSLTIPSIALLNTNATRGFTAANAYSSTTGLPSSLGALSVYSSTLVWSLFES